VAAIVLRLEADSDSTSLYVSFATSSAAKAEVASIAIHLVNAQSRSRFRVDFSGAFLMPALSNNAMRRVRMNGGSSDLDRYARAADRGRYTD